MFPDEFIKRIHTQKYVDADALLEALSEPSPNSVRINRSKWGKSPVHSGMVPWNKTGFYLRDRPSYTLDPLFHSGCYYPQEASSMFLGFVLKQITGDKKNLRVLDLCAAPGGKSTDISDIINEGSLLISNDAIRSRASILSETLTKWGSGNILVTQKDPSAFGKLKGYFDIIVVDAPCSGEGMFRSNVALNEWSVANTIHCAERQKRILSDVWPALKENGVMIYSTCTFNPGENEENLKWFVSKNEAACISFDISDFKEVIEIDFEGVSGYGFYPDKVKGEGFFLSAIRKTATEEKLQIKSHKRKDIKPGKNDLAVARKWTSFSEDSFFKLGEDLFRVPCSMEEYLFLFNNLKVIKGGTKIFTVKNTNFLPSHELALSKGMNKNAFPVIDTNLSGALAFIRRDNLNLNNAVKGWNIVAYKEVYLGFVNNIGNRLNNYFPVDWRIRMDLPEAGMENIIEWE